LTLEGVLLSRMRELILLFITSRFSATPLMYVVTNTKSRFPELIVTAVTINPSKTEQSRAVAYCRQPASTVTAGIEPRWDPWPYICSMSRLLFFFPSFVVPPLIKKRGWTFFIIGVTLLHVPSSNSSGEPVTPRGRGPPVAHEGSHLVRWAGTEYTETR
jgi:hypothetical protein